MSGIENDAGRSQQVETGEAYVLKLLQRIAELEELVYVPGLWRCAKCKLTLVSQTIHVNAGKVTATTTPQICANGCGPMWRVTERDAGDELAHQMTALRNNALEQAAIVCDHYGAPRKRDSFFAQIGEDVRAANESGPGTQRVAQELAQRIRNLKTPE